MASWQEELAMLLRQLGVTQEEPRAEERTEASSRPYYLQPTRKRVRRDSSAEPAERVSIPRIRGDGDNAEDDDAWLDDLFLMRLEVESIVSQVIRLMQRGDLDKSSKEDVMVVLQALRRRAMVTRERRDSSAEPAERVSIPSVPGDGDDAEDDDAYFESEFEFANAMLHFCRLVLHLSESAIEDL